MTLALASDQTLADALREALLARVIEATGIAGGRAIGHVRSHAVIAFVPAPDTETIDLDRPLPDGQYHILVWRDRADVVLTYLWSLSGQMASKPVANADALRDLATYVVLAAGGSITTVPTLYEAPEWLVRQVAAGESSGQETLA